MPWEISFSSLFLCCCLIASILYVSIDRIQTDSLQLEAASSGPYLCLIRLTPGQWYMPSGQLFVMSYCPMAPVSVSSLLPALLHTFPFMSIWDVLQVTMCSRIVRGDASVYILLAGIFFVLPCIESYTKVDLRTVSFDVPPQEVRLLLSTTDTSAILRIHPLYYGYIRYTADTSAILRIHPLYYGW